MRRSVYRWAAVALPLLSACAPGPATPAAAPPAQPRGAEVNAPRAEASAPRTEASAPPEVDLPPPDRAWGEAEYQAASGALKARLSRDPSSLPRRASPAFARMVDPQNLAFAIDPNAPADRRSAALMALVRHADQGMQSYVAALMRGAPVGDELLAWTAFMLRATRWQWEIMDELLPGKPMNGARLGGLAQMKHGTGEQVEGAVLVLSGSGTPAVAGFVAAARDDVGALVRRLPPGTRDAPRNGVRKLRDEAADPDRRRAFEDLLGAIERPPAGDITVTRAAIFGRDRARPLAALAADPSTGADAKHKRGGASDLHIVPLAQEAASAPALATRRRATIDLDPAAPYRAVAEVLFTLGQTGVSSCELRRADDPARALFSSPPPAGGQGGPGAAPGLEAFVTDRGVALKTSSGPVAPGCSNAGGGGAKPGTGITVPRSKGRIDLAALEACARGLKASAPDVGEVLVVAGPKAPVGELLDVADVLRGGGDDRFPIVRFGVPR